MNLTIKPLTEDMFSSYLDFFDHRAFDEADVNGPCYCTCPTQTSEEIDQMVAEFAGDVKGTLRGYAVKMLSEGKIRGYLAFDAGSVVGWCNARGKDGFINNRYQFIPDFAWDYAKGKTMSVVCFAIAPGYRNRGVATALLERVIADARVEGFDAVEGYTHLQKGQDDYNFKGPARLFERLGFSPVLEQEGVFLMRKNL